MIVNLQVGTESAPFQHRATIEMHGHVRSKELPVYGAKTLALREGTLDLHGPCQWVKGCGVGGIEREWVAGKGSVSQRKVEDR